MHRRGGRRGEAPGPLQLDRGPAAAAGPALARGDGGRPGEDGYANRVLQAWGLDGHNSHTNVCSSSARLAHFLWTGADRPSPDHAHAKTILLLSSHLESGHYFNPHAQRIIEGQSKGGDIVVSEELERDPGIRALLADLTPVEGRAALKGFDADVVFFRLTAEVLEAKRQAGR